MFHVKHSETVSIFDPSKNRREKAALRNGTPPFLCDLCLPCQLLVPFESCFRVALGLRVELVRDFGERAL